MDNRSDVGTASSLEPNGADLAPIGNHAVIDHYIQVDRFAARMGLGHGHGHGGGMRL